MTINYTTLLGLAEPVTGTESATWGDDVNLGLTEYLDAAIAGSQVISGSATTVTLSITNGSSAGSNLAQVGSGSTGSAQYHIIKCTGNPASTLMIAAPTSSRSYVVVNSTSTSQNVELNGTVVYPQEVATLVWNGSAYVKVGTSFLFGRTSINATFVGVGAGVLSATTGYNTAVGYSALNSITPTGITGINNVAVGANAAKSNTTGYNNTVVGVEAFYSGTTQREAVALGYQALYGGGGTGNTAAGFQALKSCTNANYNVAVGCGAATAVTTGGVNTAIGWNAGSAQTNGNFNVYIGGGAGASQTSGSNTILIGYDANGSTTTVSNEITLGNSNITTLRCNATTITSLSDARDKKDVAPLPSGMALVNELKPVTFVWARRDNTGAGTSDMGFLAQDLQAAQATSGVTVPGLVYSMNPNRLEAAYGRLIPVLVRAIQELSAEIEALKAKS